MRLTVEKAQLINEAMQQSYPSPLHLELHVAAILAGKSPDDVKKMKPRQLHKLNKAKDRFIELSIAIMQNSKPFSLIKANGNYYRLSYDLVQKPYNAGKYIEIAEFGKDTIKGLHMVLATMATPLKWSWRKFKYMPIERPHADIANDMLKADFNVAYQAAVFFLATFTKSINDTQLYLGANKMEMEVAKQLAENFTNLLDGFTLPKWWRNLKIAE